MYPFPIGGDPIIFLLIIAAVLFFKMPCGVKMGIIGFVTLALVSDCTGDVQMNGDFWFLTLFFGFFILMALVMIFVLPISDTTKNTNTGKEEKKNDQPAPPTIVECDFKLDFHGLDFYFYCEYYSWNGLYKGSIGHYELYEYALVIAKDKDELLQASQFIIDKWTQMKGCRVHFGDVDLSKWNREEMDLEQFVLKCVQDNYNDGSREWYESMGKMSDHDDDDDDDLDEDWDDDDDDFDEDWDDDDDDDIKRRKRRKKRKR